MTHSRRTFGRNRLPIRFARRVIKCRRSDNNAAFPSVNAALRRLRLGRHGMPPRIRNTDRFPTRMNWKTVGADRKKIGIDSKTVHIGGKKIHLDRKKVGMDDKQSV